MKSSFILWLAAFGIFMCPSPAHAELTTLEETWVDAYRNNPSLEAERAKLRALDEQVSIALSHWRPSVDLTGNAGKTYQYLPAEREFGTADFASNTYSGGVQVTQPLFRGFRTLAETEAAKKQVFEGRARLQAAEQQVLLDTSTAFLDILRDQLILSADRDAERVLQDKLKETTIRARDGDLTQTDVQQAESRLARAEVSTTQADNALSADRDTFTRLVGVEPASLMPPNLLLTDPKDLTQAVHLAETQNPDVLAAQYAVEESKAEVRDNEGTLLPEVNLVGSSSRSYGQSTTLPGRFDSSQVLAEVTIPLYHSGADYARVRAAQQTTVQHRMELEDARHKAIEGAKKAWKAMLTTTTAVKADNREITASERALTGVKVQSHAGTRTTLDVLNAEQELLDAKTDLAKSEHDRILAIVNIKAAVGELTADALKLPLEAYDPTRHYDTARRKWIGFGDANEDVYRHPEQSEETLPVSENASPVQPESVP